MTDLSNKYKRIDPKLIIIPPDRQRSGEIDTTDIDASIAKRILHPLIVTEGLVLVTGERRLRSALKQNIDLVPIRFSGDLDPLELREIELEENERRQGLPWRDHVRAVAELHEIYGKQAAAKGETWSVTKTAKRLDYIQGHLSKVFRVFRDLDNPRLKDATGLLAAYNILDRLDERKTADAMADILGTARVIESNIEERSEPVGAPAGASADEVLAKIGLGAATPKLASGAKPQPSAKPLALPPPAELSDIIQGNCLEYLASYRGGKFNFCHCDFPYGKNVFAGPQSGANSWETYNDSSDVYWDLIRGFCASLDNFLSPSAHLVFWLSADIEIMSETIELFRKLAPSLAFWPKPIVWLKSDNLGIISDPKRGGRHIYEAALVASRGDRQIVKPKGDAYAAPTDKDHHPSAKPEPVLRHFFEMFVDEQTQMLDPTCGGGSSLRAAESLNAKRVFGLEMSAEHCGNARSALKHFRVKRAMAKRG